MAIKASEISDLIRQRIQNFEAKAEARDVGTIIALTDGICRIHGLADVQYGEMIEFPGGSYGFALNLEQDSVGAVVLGDYKHISEGDTVKTTGRASFRPARRRTALSRTGGRSCSGRPWVYSSAASLLRMSLCAFASISRASTFSAPATAILAT